MDRDHSNPAFKVGAIQLHMPSFSNVGTFQPPAKGAGSLCNEPITIAHYDAHRDDSILPTIWGDKSKIKRSGRKARSPSDSRFNETLVMSYNPKHTATALCSDPMSRGPSFVSFDEGLYCDMTEKVIWPLCTTEGEVGCYDWKTHSLVEVGLRKREMDYANIIEWM